jgi:hypothetical protein
LRIPHLSRRTRAELTFVGTIVLVLIYAFILAGDEIFRWVDRWAVRPLPAAPPRTFAPPKIRTAVNLGDGRAAPWIGDWILTSRGSPKPTSESLVIRPIANGIHITVDGLGTTGAQVRQEYTAAYVHSSYFATIYKDGNATHARLRTQDEDGQSREFYVESDGKTLTLRPPQHWRDTHYVALPSDKVFTGFSAWRATYSKP